jgi:transposase
MTKKKRPNFSPEFRLGTAQLVVDAIKAMGVGYSTISKWVKQLKEERKGGKLKAAPMTVEQIEIRAFKKYNVLN